MRTLIILFITLLIKDIAAIVFPKYLGCFECSRLDVKLKGPRRNATNTLTGQHCSYFCFNNGYKNAATRNGTECHCGDLPEIGPGSFTKFPLPDDEKLCDTPCSSDDAIMCGGEQGYSLYSTGLKERDVIIHDYKKWEVGCLSDEGVTRLLWHHKNDLLRTNTPIRCMAYCRALGYPYAGVQYSFECHCGITHKTGPVTNKCNKPCSGNSRMNCGGNWHLNLYYVQSFGVSTEIEELGCFTYDSGMAIITRNIISMTPDKCIAYCVFQGLPFAHINNGTLCICSLHLPYLNTLSSDNFCDKPCLDAPLKKCGGENHMSSFRTGTNGDPSLGKLMSCYFDIRGDLIRGIKLLTGNENSVSFCIARCLQIGYEFASVRNGSECICSHSSPRKQARMMVPDLHCRMPCPKNELQNCGGESYTSVYRTGVPLSNAVLISSAKENSTKPNNFDKATTVPTTVFLEQPTGTLETKISTTPTVTMTTSNELTTSETIATTSVATTTSKTQSLESSPWISSENEIADSGSSIDKDRINIPILNTASSHLTTTGYVGCYQSDRTDISFTVEFRKTVRSLTVLQCNSYCFIKGYTFSATKNGNECYCDDLPENDMPQPDDDRLCNVPCLSDLRLNCGGINALTVYSTGIKEASIGNINKLRIGCLADVDETRLIREHKVDLVRTNTPKRCIAYCKALGYPHAGVQYKMECFCGLSQRTSPLVDGCDLPCTGDSTENCGGSWRIDVYSTGTFNDTMDIAMLGCSHYHDGYIVAQKDIYDMSPNKCVAHCFRLGLPYAHLFNGFKCLCTQQLTRNRVSLSKCNITCLGDVGQLCGGDMYMLTYSTGIIGDPILGKQESCYNDGGNDLLGGPIFHLGNDNNIQNCISRCIELGFAFAGLKDTEKCQCSHTSPMRSLQKMAPAEFCNSPCPMTELQNCGGPQFLDLYRTGLNAYNERASGAVLPKYLGCFKDSRNEIRLTGEQVTVRVLTLTACNSMCFSQGFKHAATKDGKECYCGDLNGEIPSADEESLCNVSCRSALKEMCGGRSAYSLFSTGIIEDDIDAEELEIGCLSDSDDIRLIPEHKVDLTLTNSPKRCIAYCRALGYAHAGTQYSMECYCGMSRKTYPLSDGCDKTCSGDPDSFCGGDWKANVYTTGITKPTPGVASKGCYRYEKSLFSTRKTITKMNPNKCASSCFLQGFGFAFIHEGLECLCGSNLPESRFREKSDKCNIICEGDSKQKCGGENVMSSYTTGIVGDPILGKLVGCYKDENNDLFSGPKLNLGAQNAIALCISRCMELGYSFAGLRNTFECQCSQTAPKRTPVKIVPDYECATPCPIPRLQTCGAPLFMAIHRTGVAPTQEGCSTSVSTINGKSVCGGQTLFVEEFDTLDTAKWEASVKISGENAEFVTYSKKKKNLYIDDGKLVIKPTLVKDKFVKYGSQELKGCTGIPDSPDCNAAAKSYHILPPVDSAQICTKRSFTFKYGIMTVRAKLPKGDWVVPQIWLKPVSETYGKSYLSGKLLILTSHGNVDLVSPEGVDIGARIVESGVQVASGPDMKVKTKTATVDAPEPWFTSFHNYTVSWTPDTLLFYVDGNLLSGLKTVYTNVGKTLLEEMGIDQSSFWSNGSVIAPFDQEFYLCVGVSVGGLYDFPDNSRSNGVVKPWSNNEIKARLKFFLNKQDWVSTWSNDTKLEVDSIRVTSF